MLLDYIEYKFLRTAARLWCIDQMRTVYCLSSLDIQIQSLSVSDADCSVIIIFECDLLAFISVDILVHLPRCSGQSFVGIVVIENVKAVGLIQIEDLLLIVFFIA